MPVEPSDLDKALDAIRRTYGESNARYASDKPDLERIPTGSLMLDWVTGGGIPMGRWCHFYGGYMSCKSLTCWRVIKNAQAIGKSVALYDTERRFDPVWAERHGVDLSKLIVIEGTEIENIGAKLEVLLGSVNVHVVDSVGASVSVDELAGEVGDWQPGIAARAWGKALRRANARFDHKDNTIILVNHVGEVFGRGGGEAPKGGRFIEYMSSLSLHFKRSSWLFADKHGNLSPDGEKTDSMTKDVSPSGMEFQVRGAKSSVSPPLRPARLRLDFRTMEFDNTWEQVLAAGYYGVVSRAGAWYTLPDGVTKVQGEAGLRKAILESPDLSSAITEAIREDW